MVSCSFAQAYWEKTLTPVIYGTFNSFPKWLQLIFSRKKASKTRYIVMLFLKVVEEQKRSCVESMWYVSFF